MGANAFLQALATVLGVAAITTVLFRKLRQPVVLGYLLAGFIVRIGRTEPLFKGRPRSIPCETALLLRLTVR